ncbi:MAG: hypothetical protein MI723_10975 [Caulobacterales bacterium]|nr:hypothetical protein [Caulobacterales bacterium]
MRSLFLFLAVVAFGWAGWRYLDTEMNPRGPVSFESLAETAAEPGGPVPELAASAAPMGIESVTRTRGPDLSQRFADTPLAYNRPTAMPLERARGISLVIDASAAADLAAALDGFRGEVVESEADLAGIVSASLTGPGFAIERLAPERQRLSLIEPNRWHWSVTAMEAGERFLTLEVFAYPAETAPASPVRAYRDRIEITVGPVEQALAFARHAQPAVGVAAGVASLAFGLIGFLRRK